ncbi:WD40 repeat-like protein [Suillus hirtellus]|nr:WD40 repeat-like protein [Suillus hirtellus]
MSQLIPSTTPIRTFEDNGGRITALAVFPDKRQMIAGSADKTLRLWDLETGWPLVHMTARNVYCVRYSPSGELLAIATYQNIQIYNPGTREEVASLTGHKSLWKVPLAWTPDGTCLLSGSGKYIWEWDTSTWEQVGRPWEGHTGYIINAIAIHPAGTLVASASGDMRVRLWRLSDQRTIAVFEHSSAATCVAFSVDGKRILSRVEDKISEWTILDITTARHACLAGDLSIAEELLTQEIRTNANDFTSYSNRSFVMARKHNSDNALEDATKSINIKPSLIGFISKGIALCGKGHVQEAMVAFDVASTFTNQDSETNQFLLLIKAIALFNADQHEEAMLLMKDRDVACPNIDPLARRVVETYLRVQLGIKAFDGAHHDEAADHFTAAVNSDAFSSKYIHFAYQDLTVLFGWDLESLLLTTHQKQCQAFLSAEFKEECSMLAAHNDRILGAEIPGQDHDGYDADPNFFYGMHQFITVFPDFRAKTSTTSWAPRTPQKTEARYDEEASLRRHFGTRPVIASQPIEQQSRHWNFNFKLFSGGHSTRTIDVAFAQDENRIGIVPESDAEVSQLEHKHLKCNQFKHKHKAQPVERKTLSM